LVGAVILKIVDNPRRYAGKNRVPQGRIDEEVVVHRVCSDRIPALYLSSLHKLEFGPSNRYVERWNCKV
jgi:hypothetical protein